MKINVSLTTEEIIMLDAIKKMRKIAYMKASNEKRSWACSEIFKEMNEILDIAERKR